MRKLLGLCLLFVVLLGCTKNIEVQIDYGQSNMYTKEDMDLAISMIQEEMKQWDGCELHSITYGSDDACNQENLDWMNELEEANDNIEIFTECILFKTDFHSPKDGGDAWNSDYEYTDFEWWLARSNGNWKLMTWGY